MENQKRTETKSNIQTTNKLLDFVKKIDKLAKKVIHLPYYYVPQCPVCGSRKTGRFVRYHRDTDLDYMVTSALKNGELIAPKEDMTQGNLFCDECGYTWFGSVEMKLFSLNRIQKEKKARQSDKILEERNDALREENKGKKKNFLSKFIGKI